MHQSMSAVPIPPGQPRVGGGAFAILLRPQGLGISIPRGDPRAFGTLVFERQISLSGRTRPLSKTGLSIRVWKNLSMFLKVCCLNFRYFFRTCKHIHVNVATRWTIFCLSQSNYWREHCVKTTILHFALKLAKVYEFKWSHLQDRSCKLKIFKTNGFYTRKYLMTRNLLANC